MLVLYLRQWQLCADSPMVVWIIFNESLVQSYSKTGVVSCVSVPLPRILITFGDTSQLLGHLQNRTSDSCCWSLKGKVDLWSLDNLRLLGVPIFKTIQETYTAINTTAWLINIHITNLALDTSCTASNDSNS